MYMPVFRARIRNPSDCHAVGLTSLSMNRQRMELSVVDNEYPLVMSEKLWKITIYSEFSH